MAKSDVYFQFPIRALNMGKSVSDVNTDETRTRYYEILGYCLVAYGRVNFSKDPEKNQGIAIQHRRLHDLQGDPSNTNHAEVLFADAKFKTLWPGSMEYALRAYEKINDMQGGQMFVRLRRDLFLDLQSMGWRDWAILCGIYAMLGNRCKVRITYRQINALALGFSGIKSIELNRLNELKLTDRQTQTTVDKLAKRKLFSKASVNHRHNWYSFQRQKVLENMLAKEYAVKLLNEEESKSSSRTKAMKTEALRLLDSFRRDAARADLASRGGRP